MSKFEALGLAVDQSAKMTIVNPKTLEPIRDKEGKESYLDLLSGDSDAAGKHERFVSNKRLGMRRGKVTAEQIEAENIELLVALTKGWYLVAPNGTPLAVEFTPVNARELYSDRSMVWLREQAATFIGDRGNFSLASLTNS